MSDKKIRIAEVQNFAADVIERAEKAKPEEFLNALFHLGFLYIYSAADPDLDVETKKILGLKMVRDALESPAMDAKEIFLNIQKPDEENTIIQ